MKRFYTFDYALNKYCNALFLGKSLMIGFLIGLAIGSSAQANIAPKSTLRPAHNHAKPIAVKERGMVKETIGQQLNNNPTHHSLDNNVLTLLFATATTAVLCFRGYNNSKRPTKTKSKLAHGR